MQATWQSEAVARWRHGSNQGLHTNYNARIYVIAEVCMCRERARFDNYSAAPSPKACRDLSSAEHFITISLE